jgi:hypothetical protein
MATSRSHEDSSLQARAALYSGRPDPVWTVSGRDEATLEQIWSRLLPHEGPRPRPPALGYRGCYVSGSRGEWYAYGGVVTHTLADQHDVRSDADREFERTVLASAPSDLLSMVSLRKEPNTE